MFNMPAGIRDECDHAAAAASRWVNKLIFTSPAV
jgi:hypothetical protein